MIFTILTILVAQTRGQSISCDEIYGGGWTLVRHSYWKWFEATDSLKGTDVYGAYDNNPQSTHSWSVPFANQLKSDGSTLFMFSNGDCSQWLVTTNDQFLTTSDNLISSTILASHTNANQYDVNWFVRPANPEDPWISFGNHGDTNYETLIYGENAPGQEPCDAAPVSHRCQRWANAAADKSLNVWIQADDTEFVLEWRVIESLGALLDSMQSDLTAEIQGVHDRIDNLQVSISGAHTVKGNVEHMVNGNNGILKNYSLYKDILIIALLLVVIMLLFVVIRKGNGSVYKKVVSFDEVAVDAE